MANSGKCVSFQQVDRRAGVGQEDSGLNVLCRAIGDDISNQMALDETPEGSRRQASDHLREQWSRQKKQTVAMQGLRGDTQGVFDGEQPGATG